MIFARIGHGPCYYHWNEIFAGVRSEQFLVTECFFNLFLGFLISNKLQQFKFKLEKIIGIHAGKVGKRLFFYQILSFE